MGRSTGLTRRGFLGAMAALGGAAAVYDTAGMLGLLKVRSAHAAMPPYEPGLGAGRRVAVVGAGIAGLTAAWHLARNGFEVQILEATDRIGGRCLSLRNGDRFAERDGPVQQVRFVQNLHEDGSPVAVPTYLNAGPGRIGQHSAIVLDYCREFGVALDPYIFAGESNLLQSDAAFDGRPMAFRRVRNGLRSGIAELLERAVKTRELDAPFSAFDRDRLVAALRQFGGVNTANFEAALQQAGHGQALVNVPRNGFSVDPGAGLQGGIAYPDLPLDGILASGLWDRGLFAGMEYRWQGAMLQARGGMDTIWRRMIARRLPDGRSLEGMIRLGMPVTGIWNRPDGVELVTAGGETVTAEFCVCTADPIVLTGMAGNLSPALKAACGKVDFIPATKVGGQMRGRFWEDYPDSTERIFGGISWTDNPTSQIWYPSSDFQTRFGVLTMAYNFFDNAVALGDMSPGERVEAALAQGEKFHPGQFRAHFVPGSGVSIAWHRMPYQHGAAANETSYEDPSLYRALVAATPEGRTYLAGDWLSYVPGWLDGAFGSAEIAVAGIAARVRQP